MHVIENSPEGHKRTQDAIRAENNEAVLKGSIWARSSREKLSACSRPPIVKAYTQAEWSNIVVASQRVGEVFCAMERDKERGEYLVLIDRLDLLGLELEKFIKLLTGETK